MAIPTSFSDLSTTAASNSPAGSDNVFPDLDNYLRIAYAMLASIKANTSTNGWVSPYLPNASALVFNEAGADIDARFEGDTDANLLFIDAGADAIGIGTGTPSNLLHLKAATNPIIRMEGATDSGYLDYTASRFTISAGGGYMALAAGNTERVRIDPSGNVGIGRTPEAGFRLDILGANNTTTYGGNTDLRIRSNNETVTTVYGWNQIAATADLLIGTGGVQRVKISQAGDLMLHVEGTPPTLSNNSEMVFNLTSNDNLRISVRGSDGVTRTANITLS